jgi:hypothetical protein
MHGVGGLFNHEPKENDKLDDFTIYIFEKQIGAPTSQPRSFATASPVRPSEVRAWYRMNQIRLMYGVSITHDGKTYFKNPAKLQEFLNPKFIYKKGNDHKLYYSYDLRNPVGDKNEVLPKIKEDYPYYKGIKEMIRFLARRSRNKEMETFINLHNPPLKRRRLLFKANLQFTLLHHKIEIAVIDKVKYAIMNPKLMKDLSATLALVADPNTMIDPKTMNDIDT